MNDRKDDRSAGRSITLPIEGMSCASCVLRVEKALQKLEGVVAASVNLASEKATIRFDPSVVTLDRLQSAVEASGYKLILPTATQADDKTREAAAAGDSFRRLRHELIVSAALTLPIIATFVVSIMHFIALYRRRVPIPLGQAAGAMVAAMAMQWTVAMAGLLRKRRTYERVSSQRVPSIWR